MSDGEVLSTAQTIGAVASDSIKSSMLEEDKQAEASVKEQMPIIPPGFKGIFSLKSKN
jgi:hypothetical protein